ncbi:MOSC domain-containing protein [Acidobacteria bacterium AH-259-O06]|nr:MOSC domain-containing protein [Acidobacteria bacterium AH-259-O06]
MATSGVVGSVAGLWRFPLKSMRGERLEQAELTERGLVGDRAYALIDADTGKVVSAKSVRLFPDLFGCRAAFVEPPRSGRELPPVRIALPDGTSVISDSSDIDRVLSACFRRDVTLARAAPDDFTIDQYHPDVEDLDPAGHRDTVVEQKLGSAFFAQAGLASPVPVGSFFDLFPVSVLTTSTLEQLSELRPQSRFDQRRFRMNVIVGTKEAGFVENDWIGHELAIGDAVRLSVALPDPRCVMTTLAQDELPKDTDVLRTLTRHNRVQVGDAGQFPCAGVYAVVEAPGTMRTGDRVALT